jgi:ferredoxin
MRVQLDLDRCQGYGNCVVAAPEVFDLADDGTAVLLEAAPPPERAAAVRRAAALCPAQAILVEDDGAR